MPTLRLGAAQLHYHPAFEGGGKQSLREPTGVWEGAGLSALRAGTEEGDRLLRQLRERIEKAYVAAYRPRLEAVVRFAAGLELDLLVLPEYAVPLALLPAVAEAAGARMTVIAGSHTVTPDGARKSGLYEALELAPRPGIGSAIAPVLRGGRIVAATPKLSASKWEPDLVPGRAWEPVMVGGEPLGVLICLDFLKLRDGDVAPKVSPHFDECALFAVPSLTPMLSVERFAKGGEEVIYGYGRPVVYANRAREGGTRIFVAEAGSERGAAILAAGAPPELPAGLEGVVMAEVRFGEARERYRPAVSRPLGAAVVLDARALAALRAAEEAVLAAGEAEEAFARVEAAERVFREAAGNARLPAIARERWACLGGVEGITTVDHLHALARDVWVEGLASHGEIERALVEGAVRVLREVEKKAPEAQKVVTVRGWLEGEVLKRFEGVEPASEVVEAVTEGLLPEPERAPLPKPAEDGSFEGWVKEPGPFPEKLRRQGFRLVEVLHRSHDERKEATPFSPPAPGVIRSGVLIRSLERAAKLLALWGYPPAWFAERPEKDKCFVLVDCRAVIWSDEPMAIHSFSDGPEPYADGLPSMLFDDCTTSYLANHAGARGVRRELRKLARHEGHLHAATTYFSSDEGQRFIEPAARLRGGDAGTIFNHLDKWLTSPSPIGLLLGDFGSGKSTVSRCFAARLAQDCFAEGDQPVIFVDLSAWSGPADIASLVCRALGVDNVAPYRFAVEEGECILILDGFDEMSNRLTPDKLKDELRSLFAWRTDRSKILLTCRTHLFINPAELNHVFAEATGAPLKTPGLGEIENATVLELQLFDKERIQAYLARVTGEPERAWEAMGKVYDLRNLAERPMLLDLIRQHLPALTRVEKVSLGELYETYVQKWAEWPGPDEWLDPAQKLAFAEELAFCIWNGPADAIRFDELSTILFRGKSIDWIRRFDNDAVRLELRAGTFLVWQEGGEGGFYRFAHRSFLEYMLARRAVQRLGAGDRGALDVPRFSPEVIAYCKARPGWVATRQEAAALLVDPYRRRVSENALLLVGEEEGIGSSAERPWRLEGAALGQVNLRGARLAGAWLSRANLEGAALAGADLRGVRLEGAVLDGADLARADFREAAMKGAAARGAILDGTRFDGADLREVGFEGSSAFAEAPMLNGARLEGACLTGAAWREPARSVELCGLDGAGEARWRGDEPIERAGEGQEASRVEPDWHRANVNGLAFSPSGRTIATACSDRLVRIWEAKTGRLLQTLQGPADVVTSVAWTADGECLAAGSADKTARVWETRTGRLLHTFQGHTNWVTSVAWTADGERLATGSGDNAARVWEARTGRLLQTIQGPTNWVMSVAWTADGERLATGSGDKIARVWEARTGRLLQTLQGHAEAVMSVAWVAGGEHLATGSEDKTARVWEARTGRLLHTLQGHESPVTSVTWTADGERLATGSEDKTARVWEARTGRLLHTLQGHAAFVVSVAWTADGKHLATGSKDKTARVWEARTGRLLNTLQGHEWSVTSVAWVVDGKRLATGSEDKTARVWEARTGRLLQTLQGHADRVMSVAWAADGERLVTGSMDKTARVWEARTGRLLQTLQGHAEAVMSVAWVAGREHLATGSWDKTARVWEARTGRLLQTLQGHESPVEAVAWTADGERLATGSWDQTARVWEARTGRLLQTFQGHAASLTSVAWTADGERLATGSVDQTARVWEARTGRLLHTLQGHTNSVTSVAWTADGERLATGAGDNAARVWEARTGRLLHTLQGHAWSVTSVAWVADGKRLATGSDDGTTRLWDVETARELASFLHTPTGGLAIAGPHAFPTGEVDLSAFVVRTGTASAPLALYKDLCLRPDLVAASLVGEPIPPLHIPMDTAARAVAAAAHDALVPHHLGTFPPLKAGIPITLPAPWSLPDDLLRLADFHLTLKAILPSGPLDLLRSDSPDKLSFPALPPGTHQLLLTLHLGDRHERSFTFPLNVLAENPYIAGPPVRGANLIGRDADLSRIGSLLQHGSIRLAGERRIGKTSILHHFLDHPGPHAPVWLNAEEKHDTPFREWVTGAIRDQLDGAPASPADLIPFLRRLAAAGKRPLLLFDEVFHLCGLSAPDAAWLRSLSSPPIAAVLAGSSYDWHRFFDSLPNEAGSPFNHLQDAVIGPLTEVEMKRLVARPGAAPPDEPAMRRILALSAGRPYLAQRLCQAALALVHREERMAITQADVEAIEREALVKGMDHQHRKRWAELASSEEARQAVLAYARTGADAPRGLSDVLQEQGLFDGKAWSIDPAFVMWLREIEEP